MSPSLTIIAAAAALLIYFIRSVARRLRLTKLQRDLGCAPVPRVAQSDPIFGIDLFLKIIKAAKERRVLNFFQDLHRSLGNTFAATVAGDYLIFTIEPENLQAILTKQFNDFNTSALRSRAADPLAGKGIFTSNGAFWQHSRALLRPAFARQRLADLEVFEYHVQNMINRIPRDGSTIDLQILFFRLTVDSATGT
jgi:cytochrome P450